MTGTKYFASINTVIPSFLGVGLGAIRIMDRNQSSSGSTEVKFDESPVIIEELITIAHKLKSAADRGENLPLTEDDVCFYDALHQNNSAEELMGDDQLKSIAKELVNTVRRSVTIDWSLRENARVRICAFVKRILRRFGYAPELQDEAVKLVLKQAETLSEDWAET